MTPAEAAKRLGIQPRSLRLLLQKRKIKSKKVKTPIGKYRDIPDSEVKRYKEILDARPKPLGRPKEKTNETT